MRLKSIIAAAGFVTALAALAASPALAQEKRVYEKADNASPVCAGCHEQAHLTTRLTAHGAQNDADGSSCQACHGDASLHLKDPAKNKPVNALNTKGATAEQKSAICLTCHAGSRHLEAWTSSRHRKVDVGCVSCHNIHGTQSGGQPPQHQQRAVRGLRRTRRPSAAWPTRSASAATATRAPRS